MKKSLMIIVVLLVFFSSFLKVSAASFPMTDEVHVLANESAKCKALFGDPDKAGDLAYYLQTILDIIKYAGIVLCIVLSVVDFFKAIMGEDKDMYKPVVNKMFLRLFYAVALFFLPIIVKTLLTLLDIYGTCNIG